MHSEEFYLYSTADLNWYRHRRLTPRPLPSAFRPCQIDFAARHCTTKLKCVCLHRPAILRPSYGWVPPRSLSFGLHLFGLIYMVDIECDMFGGGTKTASRALYQTRCRDIYA